MRIRRTARATALFILTGCSVARPSAIEPSVASTRVAAVVMFGDGTDEQQLYAIQSATRGDWSFAPAMALPVKLNGMQVARGAVADHRRSLIVILTGSVERPYVTVSTLYVSRGAVPSGEQAAPPDRKCVGSTWISAFFIEGLGEPPNGPVELLHTIGDSTFRLIVDPVRHTLRMSPALRLTRAEIETDSIRPERLVVSFWPSEQLQPVMPLMIRRDSVRWVGSGGVGMEGRISMSFGSYRERAPIEEWRVYPLDAPPVC